MDFPTESCVSEEAQISFSDHQAWSGLNRTWNCHPGTCEGLNTRHLWIHGSSGGSLDQMSHGLSEIAGWSLGEAVPWPSPMPLVGCVEYWSTWGGDFFVVLRLHWGTTKVEPEWFYSLQRKDTLLFETCAPEMTLLGSKNIFVDFLDVILIWSKYSKHFNTPEAFWRKGGGGSRFLFID